MRTMKPGRQGGWSLPLVLIFGFVLMTLSLALYKMLNVEMTGTRLERQRDTAQAAADAAMHRAITFLNSGGGWAAPQVTGFNSLTLLAYTEIPDASYYLDVRPGDLVNTGAADAPVDLWPNQGDTRWDRTILARVVDSHTGRVERYQCTIHRDPARIPPLSGPIQACLSIDTGASGAATADCYSSTSGAYGGANSECCGAGLQAGGSVISNLPCFEKQPNVNACPSPVLTPSTACPLPGSASITANYAESPHKPTYWAAGWRALLAALPSELLGGLWLAMTSAPSEATQPTATPTPYPVPCLGAAIIANTGSIMVNAQSGTDSYASSSGAYGGSNIKANGNIQAATTVTNNGGVIAGTTTINTPAHLTPVPTPSGLTSAGWLNVNSGSTVNIGPGDVMYDGLNINSGGTLLCAPQTRLWIKAGGSLNQSGVLRATNYLPNSVWIFMNGGNFNDNSSSVMYAALFAPSTTVNVNETIYGGVVGSSVTLNSNGHVHYDEDLGSYSKNPRCPPDCPGSLTNKTLTLGPAKSGSVTYQCGSLSLGNGTLVANVSNGPIYLYVTGALSTSGNCEIRTYPANQAAKFIIYIVGAGPVQLSGTGTYTLGMIAPEADVTVNGGGNGDFYGAISAKSYSRNGGGSTGWHYDESFNTSRINTYTKPPIITKQWRRF